MNSTMKARLLRVAEAKEQSRELSRQIAALAEQRAELDTTLTDDDKAAIVAELLSSDSVAHIFPTSQRMRGMSGRDVLGIINATPNHWDNAPAAKEYIKAIEAMNAALEAVIRAKVDYVRYCHNQGLHNRLSVRTNKLVNHITK